MSTVTAEHIAAYDRAAAEFDRLCQLAYDLESRQWEIEDELDAITEQLPSVNAALDAAWHAMIAANDGNDPTYSAERSMAE